MLDGIRRNEPDQWDRFVLLFGPIVYEWCRRSNIAEHDAADIVQEVFKVVAEKISGFRRDRPGDSFHGWLHGITRFKCLDYFRQHANQTIAAGGSTANQRIQQTAATEFTEFDETSLSADRFSLFQRALELIKTEFESHTWQAFWRMTVDDANATDIARELGMTRGAIYNAKYKVLRRLRTEFDGLITIPEESEFAVRQPR